MRVSAPAAAANLSSPSQAVTAIVLVKARSPCSATTSTTTSAISRNAAGSILVNGGAVAVSGGTPTVANTALIQVFGQGGNDTITLNEANGALPRANLFGGAGNDVITGGSGNDQLFGQAGNDTLLGKGGFDFLFGGERERHPHRRRCRRPGVRRSGDDRMIWNPGDDTDLIEGGAGTDTVEVNGGNGAEVLHHHGQRHPRALRPPRSRAVLRSTSAPARSWCSTPTAATTSFSATGNLAALISITVDGGTGNDTILGSNGADLLLGGDGDDFIDGQQGNDTALLGAGNDVFQWDPG